MNRSFRRGRTSALPLLLGWLVLGAGTGAMSQTIQSDIDPREKPGERPYEMVWARR